MKKLAIIVVFLLLLASAMAEETGAPALPAADGTGSRPTVEVAEALTMAQSAVPFARIQWGAAYEETLALPDAKPGADGATVEQGVELPGIDGIQTATYEFGGDGLECVSVILEGGLLKAANLEESVQGKVLIGLAGAYYDTQDADEMMRYRDETLYCYKSIAGDAAVGFIPSGKKYDFGIRFFPPASFDQSIFRDDALYTMTTEKDGTLDYNAAASRPVTLNINEQYKIKVAFTSGVQMHGAGMTPVNGVPRFRVVFVYFGLAEPKGVNTLIFTVDDRLFQFTIPGNYIAGGYKADTGLYRYQYSLLIGAKGGEFMNALVNAGKEVMVEMRGDDFNVSFPFIEKAIRPLAEDWENFKRAGGLAPLYVLAADETPLTIY